MSTGSFDDLFQDARQSDAYWAELAVLDFTEDLCRLMDEQQISRAELARRIGTRPSYITKVLNGNANFTLVTMTKLARAVGGRVAMHIAPEGAITHWKDELETAAVVEGRDERIDLDMLENGSVATIRARSSSSANVTPVAFQWD